MRTFVSIALASLALRLSAAEPIVAAVVCAEARGEGRIGMTAVWEVIWNRSKASGETPSAVVLKPAQFSCLNGVKPLDLIQSMRDTEGWEEAFRIVTLAPTTRYAKGANHFTRSEEHPRWTRHRHPVAVIGNHSFYRL